MEIQNWSSENNLGLVVALGLGVLCIEIVSELMVENIEQEGSWVLYKSQFYLVFKKLTLQDLRNTEFQSWNGRQQLLVHDSIPDK